MGIEPYGSHIQPEQVGDDDKWQRVDPFSGLHRVLLPLPGTGAGVERRREEK